MAKLGVKNKFESFTSPRFTPFGQAKVQSPSKDWFNDPLGVRGNIFQSRVTGQNYQQGSHYPTSTHDTDMGPYTPSPKANARSLGPMLAIEQAGKMANASTEGVFSFLNQQKSGDLQQQYLKNMTGTGEVGHHMHTSLHSNMLYSAQMQTLNERNTIMKLGTAFGGPIGAIAAYFGSKYHTSKQEKELNFNTAGGSNPSQVGRVENDAPNTPSVMEPPPTYEATMANADNVKELNKTSQPQQNQTESIPMKEIQPSDPQPSTSAQAISLSPDSYSGGPSESKV